MNEMHVVKNSNVMGPTLVGIGVSVAVVLVALFLAFLYVQAALSAISFSVTPALF